MPRYTIVMQLVEVDEDGEPINETVDESILPYVSRDMHAMGDIMDATFGRMRSNIVFVARPEVFSFRKPEPEQ